MFNLWVLLYVAVLYARPGELLVSLAQVPVLDYLAAIAAAAAVLSLVLSPRPFFDQPQDKLLVVFTCAILISNPINGWFGGAPFALSIFAPVLLCYFLIRIGLRTRPQMDRFIGVFVALNLFLAVNGLLQVYTGAGIGQVEAMETREGIRIQGTGIFNDPNDLGMTLVMTVPFVLSTMTAPGTRVFRRIFALCGLTALLLACYYTNSRGTMLGLGVVFGAHVYRRHGFFPASLLAGVGLAAILALGPSRMSELDSEEASAQGRIQAWSQGLQMFKAAPVFGVGFRRFGEYHGMVAHNSFVHVLGELGFVGAFPFVGLFFYFFRGLKSQARSSLEEPPVAGRMDIRETIRDSGLGMLTCMMFLSRQYVVVPFILLALGACYASATSSDDRGDAGQAVADSVVIGGLTVALIVAFYVIVRLFANF